MADPYVSIVQESRRPLTADDVQEIHADRTGQWPELREISAADRELLRRHRELQERQQQQTPSQSLGLGL